MTSEEINQLINKDPDFVNIKRFDYSLDRLLERYPEGAPNKVICQALQMSEEEVEELYKSVLSKLRERMALNE